MGSLINDIIEDVVDLGNQLGIEDLNAEDINEALEFDDKELTNEDIYEI